MRILIFSKKIRLLLFLFILLNCSINAIGQTETLSLKEILTDVTQTTAPKDVTKFPDFIYNGLDQFLIKIISHRI